MFTEEPAVDARAPNVPESLAAEMRRAAALSADEPLRYVFVPHGVALRDALVVTDRRSVRVAGDSRRGYALSGVKVTLGCNLSLRQMDRCSVLATPRGGKPDTLYSGLGPREMTAVARVLARGEHPGEAAAPSSGAASAGAARGP